MRAMAVFGLVSIGLGVTAWYIWLDHIVSELYDPDEWPEEL